MSEVLVITSTPIPPTVASTSKPPTSTPTANEIPSDTTISLERTMCYGTCPIYTVTIVADGTVTYNGKQFVKETGIIESSISEEKLWDLIREFEKINYFEYEDVYGHDHDNPSEPGSDKVCHDLFTDAPYVITTFTIEGNSKTINHYYGCRGFFGEVELTNLESMIDEVTNTAQWIDE